MTSVAFHLAAAYKRLPTPDHRYLLQIAIAKSNSDLQRRLS